jgi:hypothetical protein
MPLYSRRPSSPRWTGCTSTLHTIPSTTVTSTPHFGTPALIAPGSASILAVPAASMSTSPLCPAALSTKATVGAVEDQATWAVMSEVVLSE